MWRKSHLYWEEYLNHGVGEASLPLLMMGLRVGYIKCVDQYIVLLIKLPVHHGIWRCYSWEDIVAWKGLQISHTQKNYGSNIEYGIVLVCVISFSFLKWKADSLLHPPLVKITIETVRTCCLCFPPLIVVSPLWVRNLWTRWTQNLEPSDRIQSSRKWFHHHPHLRQPPWFLED